MFYFISNKCLKPAFKTIWFNTLAAIVNLYVFSMEAKPKLPDANQQYSKKRLQYSTRWL